MIKLFTTILLETTLFVAIPCLRCPLSLAPLSRINEFSKSLDINDLASSMSYHVYQLLEEAQVEGIDDVQVAQVERVGRCWETFNSYL